MCEFLSNSGMGKLIDTSSSLRDAEIVYPSGVWHTTHQYALEVLFHERLKQYKCLSSPDVADLFYIPYYGGLDVMRWHFVENISNSQKDQLGQELVNWLREQPAWQRRRGLDHVLVLGKITWDFRRPPEDGASWGSSLLWKDEMANITKLLIEREPWQKNEVGIPHPTFFHPRSDMDVKAWQNHAASQKRRFLVSFAGQGRPNQPESIRSELIRQCLVSSKKKQINMNSSCHFLNCTGFRCDDPTITMKVFLESEFCMQPSGDSPTRRSVFDSLISGCIPVLFDPFSAYFQYPWHLPEDSKSYSVFFRAEDVKAGKIDLIKELRRIPAVTREEMRLRIIHDIMPGLVYARPDARLEEADDAFVISLKSLFARVSQRSS
ncbi:hypothetical protein KP509_22G014400 [Ceratopteris richardii]|nr:hypothetical protein KP509_22G014400 [Ceratopteris richardii]